jgi:putative ABC transport system substrate-binding protein
MPVIGFLNSLSSDYFKPYLAAFRQGLKQIGYVEGQNVAIEYRWADGQYDRLPALATDLVQREVAVIAATGGDPSALAAKRATGSIPIVFNVAEDPVNIGLVTSLNRPGSNMTGVSILTTSLEAKRLELLHELIPTAVTIGVLRNPKFSEAATQSRILEAAARSLARRVRILDATSDRDIEDAFGTLVQEHAGALLIASDPSFVIRREHIVALAARYAIPTVYFIREFVTVGGLMSYGSSLYGSYRQMGIYAGRILKGEKPADLPVVQPTKFELVINLTTAKTIGIQIPPTLLVAADEVIE